MSAILQLLVGDFKLVCVDIVILGLPRWWSGKEPPADAGDNGDKGRIPGSGGSPGGGRGNPVQYSCLEKPHGQRAWWATVHRAAKCQTQLK